MRQTQEVAALGLPWWFKDDYWRIYLFLNLCYFLFLWKSCRPEFAFESRCLLFGSFVFRFIFVFLNLIHLIIHVFIYSSGINHQRSVIHDVQRRLFYGIWLSFPSFWWRINRNRIFSGNNLQKKHKQIFSCIHVYFHNICVIAVNYDYEKWSSYWYARSSYSYSTLLITQWSY